MTLDETLSEVQLYLRDGYHDDWSRRVAEARDTIAVLSVMETHVQQLAAAMLRLAADHYGNHGCNDFMLPSTWTDAQCADFNRRYHEWNGDPEEFDPARARYMPDFSVMAFLAFLLDGRSDVS